MLLKTADHTVDSFGIVYIGGFRDLKGETKSVYMIGADQFADLFDKISGSSKCSGETFREMRKSVGS